MCGFIAAFGNAQEVLDSSALCRALERMRRRGPDDEGTWQGEGVVLGHRRLAVLDLDPRAAQPMQSIYGRYVIVFNGEIYNFRTLRHDLESRGVVFRTTSDTEVILALFATGGVSRDPDPRGQAGFWMLGSVPEPHTWFRDLRALPAGHCAWIENGRLGTARCWHDIGDAWRGAGQRAAAVEDVAQRVQAALRESVARHLVADVPVGVFLSGGIDSGAMVGLLVEAGARELEGVTIAYDEFAGL